MCCQPNVLLRLALVLTMANLVDRELLWHAQLAVLVEGLLLKEKADVVYAVLKVGIMAVGLGAAVRCLSGA